jgi:hypothetical protein
MGRSQLFQGNDAAQDVMGLTNNPTTDIGQGDPAFGTFEELHAQPFFQLAQLTTQGWLTGIAAHGGSTEMKLLGNGNKVLKVTGVHGFGHPGSTKHLPDLSNRYKRSV